MKAAYYNGRGDIRVTDMAEPTLMKDSDAIVRVTLAAICGADLDFTNSGPELGMAAGTRLGHEFVGVVVAIGKDVRKLRVGDRVVSSYCFCDDSCFYCRKGLHTSCEHGGVFGSSFWGQHAGGDVQGGQAEYVRVPQADGTLWVIPEALADTEHDAKILPVGDNLATGYHGVLMANVSPGGALVVIGDGAVAQCAVQAATLFGAARIVMIGHHDDRLKVATALGATDIINTHNVSSVDAVKALTDGRGADSVIDTIGSKESLNESFQVARDGASISVLGPKHLFGPVDAPYASMFLRNIRIHAGLCPASAYIPLLLKVVETGRLDPSRIFTHTLPLAETPRGYEIMNSREFGSIKVALRPSFS